MKKLILLLIITSLLLACGNNENNTAKNTTPSQETTNTAEAAETRPPLDLPVTNYEGYQFRILSVNSTVTGNGTHPGFNYYSDFTYVPERAGEPINDAIYYRNLRVNEDFNVEIINTEVADVFAEARKIIASGEDVYDIITPYMENSFRLAEQKYLVNLFDVPYLNLKNPWWDQSLIENLSLNNKLYTITGEISMQDEDLNWCIIGNKVLMEEYQVPDLYSLVREGKWTLDRMYEIGTSVTHDLNGDGVINWEDVYAFGESPTGCMFYYFAGGENIAVLDKDGYPQLTLGNERALSVVDRITEIFNDFNFIIWPENAKGANGVSGWQYFRVMFKENRLMLFSASMYCVKELRDMVDDFAILPGPKYDEKQDTYYMIQSTHACPGISIPITNSNLERTGILLEAIAYHSKSVQEAYYDITLTGKFTRDEESRDMLDIIFTNVTYDIGKAFGWGGYISQMTNAVNGKKGFAALVEANKVKAETEIEKSFDLFLE